MSLWFSKSIFSKIFDFRHLASLQFTNISRAVMHEHTQGHLLYK